MKKYIPLIIAAASVALSSNTMAEVIDQSTGAKYVSVNAGRNPEGDMGIRDNVDGMGATGDFSLAVGTSATATGVGSVALGGSTNSTGLGSIAVGADTASSGDAATAIGQGASATGNSTVAVGNKASADAGSTTAVGNTATATAENATSVGAGSKGAGNASTAIGVATEAVGDYTTALGRRATATEYAATALGNGTNASGRYSTAIGSGAAAQGATSVALGTNAEATGGSGVAIGRGAKANNDASVALGSYAITETAVGTNEATVGGITYSGFAGNTPDANVSVGGNGITRTITNVAAGRITAESTDAINGSQLYMVADQVGTNAANITNIDGRLTTAEGNIVNLGDRITVAEGDIVNLGDRMTTAEGDIADNTSAINSLTGRVDAAEYNIISLDGRVSTNETDIVQLQKDVKAAKSVVTEGKNITVTESKGADGQSIYNVATKDDVNFTSVITGPVVVSTTGINAGDLKVTNVAPATISATSKDAVNGSQLYATNQNVAGNTAAINVLDGRVTQHDADIKAAKTEVVAGDNMVVTSVVGANGQSVYTVATAKDVTFNTVSANTVTTGPVSISTTGVNAGGLKVTNVAAGEVSETSTDAVNGSQLHATNVNVQNISNKVDSFAGLFGDLSKEVKAVRDDMEGGLAGVNAAASLPQVHRAGQSSIAAAVGAYGDAQAIAVGFSSISDTGRWTVKGQVNYSTKGKVGGGAGIAYNF